MHPEHRPIDYLALIRNSEASHAETIELARAKVPASALGECAAFLERQQARKLELTSKLMALSKNECAKNRMNSLSA